MNEFTVLGIRHYNFTDLKTNQELNGYSLFISQPFGAVDGNSAGCECTKISISVEMFNNLQVRLQELVGKKVNIFYNNRGKVQSIQLVK